MKIKKSCTVPYFWMLLIKCTYINMSLFCPLCSTNTFEPLEHIKVNVSPLATHGEALPSHHLLQRRSSEASTGGAAIIRTPKQQQGLADVKCRGEIKVIASASVAELNRYRANSQICPPCQRVTHLITSQYGRRPPPTRRRVHCQLISMTSSGGELAGLGFFLITKHIRSLRVSR